MVVCAPWSLGDKFEDPQWMPETTDSTKLYVYCFILYNYDKV